MTHHPVDADGRGEVVDDIDAGDQRLDQLGVQNGSFDELELRPIHDGGEIGAAASRKVIQDGDTLAILDEAFDQVRTDEARAASDQRASRLVRRHVQAVTPTLG